MTQAPGPFPFFSYFLFISIPHSYPLPPPWRTHLVFDACPYSSCEMRVILFRIHINSIDVKIVLSTRFLKLTPPTWLPSPCLLSAGWAHPPAHPPLPPGSLKTQKFRMVCGKEGVRSSAKPDLLHLTTTPVVSPVQ